MPLYVTVTPGTTVLSSTSLDASTLNRLGLPVVDITGTIDGTSSVTVGGGTVTNAMMAARTGPLVIGRDGILGTPQDITLDGSLQISGGSLGLKDSAGYTTGITSSKLAPKSVTDAAIGYAAISNGKLERQKPQTLFGNPTASSGSFASPHAILIGSGLSLTGPSEVSLAGATATRVGTNLVTVSGAVHGLSSGDFATITGMTDSSFNAYNVAISWSSSTQFSYTNYGPNGTSATASAYARRTMDSAATPLSTLSASAGGVVSAYGTVWMTGFSAAAWTRITTTVTITFANADKILPVGSVIRMDIATGGTTTAANYTVTSSSAANFTVENSSGFFTSASGTVNASVAWNGYRISSVTKTSTTDITVNCSYSTTAYSYTVVANADKRPTGSIVTTGHGLEVDVYALGANSFSCATYNGYSALNQSAAEIIRFSVMGAG